MVQIQCVDCSRTLNISLTWFLKYGLIRADLSSRHYKTIIYIQYFSTFNRYQSNFYFLILFLINSVLMIGFCINPFLSPLTFSYSRWSLLNSLAGRSATGGMPPTGVSKSSASSANSLRYSSIIENTHVQTVM